MLFAQVFLMMMCTMKYGVFIFFGAWQTIALIFVLLFLPETRGVPIERVRPVSLAFRCQTCFIFLFAGMNFGSAALQVLLMWLSPCRVLSMCARTGSGAELRTRMASSLTRTSHHVTRRRLRWTASMQTQAPKTIKAEQMVPQMAMASTRCMILLRTTMSAAAMQPETLMSLTLRANSHLRCGE